MSIYIKKVFNNGAADYTPCEDTREFSGLLTNFIHGGEWLLMNFELDAEGEFIFTLMSRKDEDE